MPFLNYNGKIIDEATPILTATNRGIRFGDGFFESMAMFKGSLVAVDYHIERIQSTCRTLDMRFPDEFTKAFVNQQVDTLSFANRISNARVRIQFFRNGGGLYRPESNETSFIITQQDISYTSYPASDGIEIVVFDKYYKPLHALSALKSSNALLYVLAAQYALEMDVQDSIILNEKGNVSEASSSNIFVVLGDKLITPSVSEGCVDGVMRKVILQLALELNLEISEGIITESDLEFASEVFLTNATRGVVYVSKFGEKVYEVRHAKRLLKALNEAISGGRF